MTNCFILILKQIDTAKNVVGRRFIGAYEDTDLLEADYQRGLVAGALMDIDPTPPPQDENSSPATKLLFAIRKRRGTEGPSFFPPLTTFYIDSTGEAFGFNDVELLEVPFVANHQYLNENR
jgi:hypothetical protein